MGTPNTTIRDWLKVATPDEARSLATAAKTSVPHLRHIAAGRRGITPEMAQRLVHASRKLNVALYLNQLELCTVCARCPLVTRKRR